MDRLLTTEEAAELCSVSVITLARWRKEPGAGPNWVRIGPRLVRYRLSAVQAWLDEQQPRGG